ncbi:MAG: hypothetical protein DRQ61_12085 [Gammaproteobacteria bacterium]|nr:MAG: hypothetical protein DRQ61_12085 [Gammaproteobacteria bacterium]
MEFILDNVEKTTAITDAILAVMAIASAMYLCSLEQKRQRTFTYWIWAFGLLGLAAILGTFAHGFKISSVLQTLLWYPLNLSLGLLVAFILVAVVNDLWGKMIARRLLPVMLLISVGFFGITLIEPDSFLPFIIYEAVVMLFALGGYIWAGYREQFKGAWWMAAGIFVTIVAAGVQASGSILFTFIWIFDQNGAYHLIQMVGIVLLVIGLRKTRRHLSL